MTNQFQPPVNGSSLPPYSQEAEEAVIGAVIVDPSSFDSIAAFLKPDDFYLIRHSLIWQALLRLHDQNAPIDYLTVTEELRNFDTLEEVGGSAYLLWLINKTPTSIHAEFYGRLVERNSLRRRLLQAAEEIKALAYDEELTVDRVVDEAETRLFNVTDNQQRREFTPMNVAISEYFDHIEKMVDNRGEPMGLPSGFKDLDKLLGGFQRSDLLIFAGRPGMGKTSFLLTVALNAARFGARVGIFTMEMGVEQITQRIVAMETGINMQQLRLGQLSPQQWDLFVRAAGNIEGFSIFIDDTPALNPMQMRTKCRRLQHEHGLDLVILDYLQLMNGGSNFANNRVQEISYISRSIKELARELNVPIFSAAQLSRAVEQRQDKRPQLSDLRESGSLEQDSDIVMFLYRDVVYNEATENPNSADIIVAKHRNGPTGSVQLFFNRAITRFEDGDLRYVNLDDL